MSFEVIDVVIGLALAYGMLAILCSGVQELIAGYFGLRGKALWEGIESMLAAGDISKEKDGKPVDLGQDIADLMAQHPRITGMVPDVQSLWQRLSWGFRKSNPTSTSLTGRRKPSYLSSSTFSALLVEALHTARKNAQAVDQAIQAGDNALFQQLPGIVSNLPPESKLKAVLTTMIIDAQGDVDRLRDRVESWFNETMEQVSGWYRRRTQFMLLIIGFLLAALLNANSIRMVQVIWHDPSLRATLINEASNYVSSEGAAKALQNNLNKCFGGSASATQAPAENSSQTAAVPPPQASGAEASDDTKVKCISDTSQQLVQLGAAMVDSPLPIGWGAKDLEVFNSHGKMTRKQCVYGFLMMLAGWIITAVAISLDAPFWFGLMSRLLSFKPNQSTAGK